MRFTLKGKIAEILAQLKLLRELKNRLEVITCPHCGAEWEREINA